MPISRINNAGNLDMKIPNEYIDLLAKYNFIKKDINDLNVFKYQALNNLTPHYLEKIKLEKERWWYLKNY